MRRFSKGILLRAVIVLSSVMIALCYAVSILTVEKYAKDDCLNSIEETTAQISEMFDHSMHQNHEQLKLFAKLMAANDLRSEEVLQEYMEIFCKSHSFSSICIHTRDGKDHTYGEHPHDWAPNASFAEEAVEAPYSAKVYSMGPMRSQQFIYQSAPIVRNGEVIAVVYGFISLDTFSSFIASTAYDGRCQFYIVDGDNGNFLMDEYHRYDADQKELPLYNMFDGSMGDRKTKPGYRIEDMRKDIAVGESGYYIFQSQRTGQWYYTYYMPMGINNWSMQLTIDEPAAFAAYFDVRNTVAALMLCAVAFSISIVLALLYQNRDRRTLDQASLHQADYRNAVRGALITAHNNPGFVDRALQIVAEEMGAETAMLLSFTDNIITGAHYWPSTGKAQAMSLKGRNLRDDFPMLYDAMSAGKSFIHDPRESESWVSDNARQILERFGVQRLVMVPILDTNGVPRASLSMVNPPASKDIGILQSVTFDFFMAITNLESHNIIKQMGAIDYLTGVKNRNSFEAESPGFETSDAENLWCVFVDVNGLHELNNTQGHKAGDAMLCAVAGAMKKIFGFENVYRLGGDEFLAFKENSTHETLMGCKYRLQAELERKGYSVSVGFEGGSKNENHIFDVEAIMTEAEKIMYHEKQKYYLRNPQSSDRHPFPQPEEHP